MYRSTPFASPGSGIAKVKRTHFSDAVCGGPLSRTRQDSSSETLMPDQLTPMFAVFPLIPAYTRS